MPLDLIILVNKIRAALPGVVAVYLFGSSAAGEDGAQSDIDLAILNRSPISSVACWDLAQDLASEAGRDVDVVDLRAASTVMRAQTIANGHRLYCANERECTEFEDYVFSAYARFNEGWRGILQDIRRRGSVYG